MDHETYRYFLRKRKVQVMRLFDLLPDGNLLGGCKEHVRRHQIQRLLQALREKLLASALPTQREFLEDTDHRIIGLHRRFWCGQNCCA